MTRSIGLPRGFVIAFLSSIYMLGFIITPYWILHNSMAEIIFYLILTIAVGLTWVLLSASSFQIEFNLKDIRLFLLLLAGMAVLNYRALNSVLPFRGDEGSHIERTLELVSRLPILPSLAIIILFIAFMLSGLKRQKWAIAIGVFTLLCVIFYFLGGHLFADLEKYPQFFLRWPFINYWFLAVIPKLASLVSSPYHEALYRIIPFLFMFGVAWIVQEKIDAPSLPSKIAWGIAVASIPLVFYYSSILYVEPPAVCLMTIACLDINNLLHRDSKAVLKVPGWYALLLIGFIKETTFLFLLSFIAVRAIVQLRAWAKRVPEEKSGKTFLKLLIGELAIAFSLLVPVILYIYFRVTLISARDYSPHIENLIDLTVYPVILRAFLEQFGPFLFFFLGGCIWLAIKRQFTPLLYYVTVIVVTLVFHIMDIRAFIGYSRFNLFILPVILAGSVTFITWASRQKRYASIALLLIAIGSNLLLSPIHLDGTKAAYWGNYLTDTGEHYYPYQDALIWLKNNQAEKRMLFTGMDFYYPFQFYWNKLDWKPKKDGIPSEGIADETLAISSILKKAESERYGVVVYRVLGKDPVLPQDLGGFRVQVIKNSARTLLIFYKP